MVNLTLAQRDQKKINTAKHLEYALDFLRHKLRNATVAERNAGVVFRFTEFANYLVDNSPEFIKDRKNMYNEETGESFPKSYYINSRRVRIMHILDQLIIKKHVSMRGRVPSARDPGVSVMLYSIDAWDI